MGGAALDLIRLNVLMLRADFQMIYQYKMFGQPNCAILDQINFKLPGLLPNINPIQSFIRCKEYASKLINADVALVE